MRTCIRIINRHGESRGNPPFRVKKSLNEKSGFVRTFPVPELVYVELNSNERNVRTDGHFEDLVSTEVEKNCFDREHDSTKITHNVYTSSRSYRVYNTTLQLKGM